MDYDVAVIGGGPGGYSAALKVSQLGGRVLLFEKDKMGGTCLNVGCIPTKCYVAQAELIEQIKKNTEIGIFKDAGLFSFKKIVEEKERVVNKLTSGIGELLKAAGVKVVAGEAQMAGPTTIIAAGKEYNAKNVILANGSRNMLPPIQGVNGKNVLDSTSFLSLNKLPRSLIAVGAGVIGLEISSVLTAFGCKVAAVDILPGILPEEDAKVAGLLWGSMKKAGVAFELNSRVVKIEDKNGEKCVTLEQNGMKREICAEYVLISVGRQPNNELAKSIGVRTDEKGFVKTDQMMRTNVSHVFAVGDLIGGYLLAHSAYAEAEVAAKNCMGANEEVDLSVMPRCIFTLPTLAAVGNTIIDENSMTGEFPFSANGKALAGGKKEGLVKWVANRKTQVVTGCTILGGEAAELIHAALIAIYKQCTVNDFERMIFPHPTLGESVKEAALDSAGRAMHLPKKLKHIKGGD